MNWNKLSLKQKADIIKLSVLNGITNLSVIQLLYDSFQLDKQDTDLSYTAGSIVDNLHKAAIEEKSLGTPSHNYDFTLSEEWANAHGYYPDSRGHRDDRVKKLSHPTHPSRGTWNSDKEFQLTNLGFEDPNYTIFGMADGNLDPSAILSYKGNIVLPELTVTPKGNYYNNSYDNVLIKLNKGGQVQRKNRFEDGGTIEPVDYETPWGITTRSRYRGVYTAPTSALYFKSKEDRDAYAALLDIDLYGGELPELEVTAKGTPTQDILTEGIDQNIQLEEKPTTQRSPYADRFFNISDWDSLLGQTRVNLNKRQSPNFMDNWTLNYNNTIAPIVNMGKFAFDYLFPRPLGVLDLSNEFFDQIIDPNKLYLYILVNDFVEDNPNNIRQAKDFYNTTDTLIGDNQIPLSSMPLFSGVEDNKFKIDSLNRFNPYTTVVPIRSRNRPGGYTELIPPNLRISEWKQKDKREANRLMYEKYPMNFWDRLTGKISRDYRTRALNYRNLVLDSLERIHGPYEIGNRWLRGITASGDTIPITDMRGRYKAILYSPTTRRTIFTGDMSNPDNLLQINTHLKNDPSYIGIFDNGRYYHTTLNNTVLYYKAPWDNLNNMFIIGVK